MQEEEENNSKRLSAEATGISLSKKTQVNTCKSDVDITGLPELNSQFHHGFSLHDQFYGKRSKHKISSLEINIENGPFFTKC